MPLRYPRRAGLIGNTGQTTIYAVGDDASMSMGLAKRYETLTASQYSGTTNIDSPHYAAATIAFVMATKKITDSASLLATVKTGDTIRIRGSTSNDGVYTVATGNVAGEIVVNESLADEIAGAYVTICKRAAISNNAVQDLVTGRMWLRYTTGGPAPKIGAASDGKVNWDDATTCFTLHPAGADLQMVAASKILRIVGGAADLPRYFWGMVIVCSGFANAANNLPGYRVDGVAINGADLDLTLWTGNTNPLVVETAAGARTNKVVCQNIYGFFAAANIVGVSSYTDWHIPSDLELASLRIQELPNALPNATVFPSWSSTANYFSSTTRAVGGGSLAMMMEYNSGWMYVVAKTPPGFVALVRNIT